MMEILRAQTSLEARIIVPRLIRSSGLVRQTGEEPARSVALAASQTLYQQGLAKDTKISNLRRGTNQPAIRPERFEAAIANGIDLTQSMT
jgi:hypothetical protein